MGARSAGGFTAFSEQAEPEEVMRALGAYHAAMGRIVMKHGATLERFTGDAIMLFFGDPVPQDDHAQRAVRMAFEMRERMTELRERWLHKYHEAFEIGIGIATGWVTVGDIGSAARSDYTVLGNQVNLASRLADRAEAGASINVWPRPKSCGGAMRADCQRGACQERRGWQKRAC